MGGRISFNRLLLYTAIFVVGGGYLYNRFVPSNNDLTPPQQVAQEQQQYDDYQQQEEFFEEEKNEIVFNVAEFTDGMVRPKKPVKILFDSKNAKKVVDLTKIIYGETTKDGKLKLHLESTDYELDISITKFKEKIAEYNFFYSALQSYIINMDKVESIEGQQLRSNYVYKIKMSNDPLGITLPREKKKDFEEALKEYLISE